MNPLSTSSVLRGRCIALEESMIAIRNESGLHTVPLDPGRKPPIRVGDIVEIRDGVARALTPNRTSDPGRMRWLNHVLDSRRRRAVVIRQGVESGIREFFAGKGFHETRTPLLVPSPGMEPHIRPFQVTPACRESSPRRAFLPTSPEFAMKRLLVGGLEKIFQICPAFRDEPGSVTHLPEFTMLEWYRAYAGYEEIMRDTEELFESLAGKLFGKSEIQYQGRRISVAAPWPRLRVRDLFARHAGVDLVACPTAGELAPECARLGLKADLSRESWDDLYFKIWLNVIEPKLPADQAVFVTRYPESQASLSVVDADPDGSRWAKRFEPYLGGLELGNAFEELTDPVEQRGRFAKDMELRRKMYGPDFPPSPIDEEFLGALEEGMPPSGGIAVGVDRMVMLFADEPEIGYTMWLSGRV